MQREAIGGELRRLWGDPGRESGGARPPPSSLPPPSSPPLEQPLDRTPTPLVSISS
jgi:hypothetical protein